MAHDKISDNTPSEAIDETGELLRDEQFYFRIVVFRAGNTLFKVPTYSFPADEGIFASMFALPKASGKKEGSSDSDPIHLPPEVTAFDFKSLLKACLPQPLARAPPKLTVDEWMSVLKLSTMWNLDDLRLKAVDEADEEVKKLGDVEKLVLAKRYSVSRWMIEACEALAMREAPIDTAERNRLGVDTSFHLFDLRERSWVWGDVQDPHHPGARLAFDFQSSIHEIFRVELLLDKEYEEPKRDQEQ